MRGHTAAPGAIIIHGACGRMGRVLAAYLAETEPGRAVLGVDRGGGADRRSLADCGPGAACVIDFSHPSTAGALARYAVETGTPLVVATTGHRAAELDALWAASRQVPVFLAANLSIGIAVLGELAKQAAAAMPEADIEIVECHHKQKLDAPSGTALALAEALRTVRPGAVPVAGRSGHGLRRREEIGIHSLRMGGVTGVHEVIVTSGTQSIALRHEAYDRRLYAEGALRAANFIMEQEYGMYGMRELLAHG